MSAIVTRTTHLPPDQLSTAVLREQWSGGSDGVTAKSVQAVDDDATTLGLEAARTALDASVDVDALVFATTTPPYGYGSVTPMLCEALEFPTDTYTLSLDDSARAGTAALRAAHETVETSNETALVIAAEAPAPEPGTDREKTAGAGAAAVLVRRNDEAGLVRVAQGTDARSVLEEWQAPADGERHTADDRFARDWGYVDGIENAVDAALEKGGWSADGIDALVLQQPNPRFVSRVGRALGVSDDAIVAPDFARDRGDLGSASALAVLSQVEVDEGDRIVVAGYGAGVADAIAYEAASSVEASPIPNAGAELGYVEYLERTGNLRRSP